MAKDGTDGGGFQRWLDEARIPRSKRSPEQLAVLRAAFSFLEETGADYASRRIVAHFLLHSQIGLKLAQVARLVGVTRPTASRQNKLSSRQVVREIHHRLSGRPYGKLLPRYAGPVAHFLVTHPQATRDDLVDFIEKTWNIRVGLTALHRFLNKYGLDRDSLDNATPHEPPHPATDEEALKAVLDAPPGCGLPVPRPPDDFFLATPPTPGPSSCFPKSSGGGKSPGSASLTTMAR